MRLPGLVSSPNRYDARRLRFGIVYSLKNPAAATRRGLLRTPQLPSRAGPSGEVKKGSGPLLRCRHLRVTSKAITVCSIPDSLVRLSSATPRAALGEALPNALKTPACVCLRLLSRAYHRPLIAPIRPWLDPRGQARRLPHDGAARPAAVRLFTLNGHDWTGRFPFFAGLVQEALRAAWPCKR